MIKQEITNDRGLFLLGNLDNGSLAEAFHLAVELSGQHEGEELAVAEEGPEGVPVGARGVALHEEVGVAGEAIGEEGGEEEEPPLEHQGRHHKRGCA